MSFNAKQAGAGNYRFAGAARVIRELTGGSIRRASNSEVFIKDADAQCSRCAVCRRTKSPQAEIRVRIPQWESLPGAGSVRLNRIQHARGRGFLPSASTRSTAETSYIH